MGFEFSNNWPYSASYFPTMEDHVDPVNHTYFTDLHKALQDIQYFLGLQPEIGFHDVAQKLNLHGHTGGDDGIIIPALTDVAHMLELGPDQYLLADWDSSSQQAVDCSSYVPVGAKAILVHVEFSSDQANYPIYFWPAATYSSTSFQTFRVHEVSKNAQAFFIIKLNTSREFGIEFNKDHLSNCVMRPLGYFI